jgi:hypothetical protein
MVTKDNASAQTRRRSGPGVAVLDDVVDPDIEERSTCSPSEGFLRVDSTESRADLPQETRQRRLGRAGSAQQLTSRLDALRTVFP